MQTNHRNSTNATRPLSLLAVVAITFGIAFAAHEVGQRPLSDRTPVVSSQARPTDGGIDSSPMSNTVPPHFERSNDPAVEMDPMNAHGG